MIVVAGESLVDVLVDADGDTVETPGGSPLNVAVGLARLDVPATLITEIGHDERATMVVRHLRASGAEVVTAPSPSGRTPVATARVDRHGVARYEFDIDWSLPLLELPRCRALHVGSLGVTLPPGRESVLDLVEQATQRGVFVSYDVNVRDAFLDDRDRTAAEVRALAARCSLVKLSEEDCGLLAPTTDPADVARSLLAGAATTVVVLTRGAEGATGFTATAEVRASSPVVEVVDTIGAGDAFMAGLLAQLWDASLFTDTARLSAADDLGRLLRGAATVAALTCARRGAEAPRRAELPPRWPD